MKKIKFLNVKTGNDFSKDCSSQEEIDQYISWCQTLECIGKPEREIVALSESYLESDVLSTRSEEVEGVVTDYVTLKAEYVVTEEDITSQYEAEQLRASRLAEGKKARQCCADILDLIGGFNVENSLSTAQIQQMMSDFSSAYSALSANMPRTVRTILGGMNPVGSITQLLLDDVDSILTRYGY